MTALPEKLEPEYIKHELEKILGQIEMPKDFMKNLVSLMEGKTKEYKNICEKIVGLSNENQKNTNEVLDLSITKLKEKTEGIGDELNTNAKQLMKVASTEVQQHHQKAISPTALK